MAASLVYAHVPHKGTLAVVKILCQSLGVQFNLASMHSDYQSAKQSDLIDHD